MFKKKLIAVAMSITMISVGAFRMLIQEELIHQEVIVIIKINLD